LFPPISPRNEMASPISRLPSSLLPPAIDLHDQYPTVVRVPTASGTASLGR
jgi:hypothetical protein